MNVIPTCHYLPDWRFLLKRPKEGLFLIQKLRATCERVFEQQFFSNKQWLSKYIKPQNWTAKALCEHVASGFNYPPSQYQLHLQFILPPFLPFQYKMYLEGISLLSPFFIYLLYIRFILFPPFYLLYIRFILFLFIYLFIPYFVFMLLKCI